MKNAYSYSTVLVLGAASLSSCSRAGYSFNNQAPAYLDAQPVAAAPRATAPTVPAVAGVAAVAPEIVVAAPAASATAPVAAAPVAAPTPVPAAQPTVAATPASALVASAPARTARPTLAQRLVLQKALKQLTKASARQQNTASITHTTAKFGGGAGYRAGRLGADNYRSYRQQRCRSRDWGRSPGNWLAAARAAHIVNGLCPAE